MGRIVEVEEINWKTSKSDDKRMGELPSKPLSERKRPVSNCLKHPPYKL